VNLGWDSGTRNYRAFASEAGMASFNAQTEEEQRLEAWLLRPSDGGHVTVERVVSGQGIGDIYKFLRRGVETNTELDRAIMASATPAALITQHAAGDAPDKLCVRAMEIFLTALGAEAGDTALRMRPLGGVFLAGGVVSKIAPFLENGTVARAYLNKGKARVCCSDIPLKLVLTPGDDLAMAGATEFARSCLLQMTAIANS
jgi:glucokinase